MQIGTADPVEWAAVVEPRQIFGGFGCRWVSAPFVGPLGESFFFELKFGSFPFPHSTLLTLNGAGGGPTLVNWSSRSVSCFDSFYLLGPTAFGLGDVVIYPEPYVPIGPILLAGDVVGSGYPTIPNALVNVVIAGSVGDATHVPVITYDAKGRIIAASQVPIGGASGVSIGDPIGGGTPQSVLFVDAAGELAQSPHIFFDTTNGWLRVEFGTLSARLGDQLNNAAAVFENSPFTVYFCSAGGQAIYVTDGVRIVQICDGTNAITYVPGNPADWNGTPPTDVWIALDRLAAWMTFNFPGNTPP